MNNTSIKRHKIEIRILRYLQRHIEIYDRLPSPSDKDLHQVLIRDEYLMKKTLKESPGLPEPDFEPRGLETEISGWKSGSFSLGGLRLKISPPHESPQKSVLIRNETEKGDSPLCIEIAETPMLTKEDKDYMIMRGMPIQWVTHTRGICPKAIATVLHIMLANRPTWEVWYEIFEEEYLHPDEIKTKNFLMYNLPEDKIPKIKSWTTRTRTSS